MLNYLGPNFGPSPVTAGLPPTSPGTIPSAIPGAPSGGSLSPTGAILPSRPLALPPQLNGAVNPAGPGGPPPPPAPDDPSQIQYSTETQQDGTVLLRMKNPDGSPGPVVKIVQIKARPSASQ